MLSWGFYCALSNRAHLDIVAIKMHSYSFSTNFCMQLDHANFFYTFEVQLSRSHKTFSWIYKFLILVFVCLLFFPAGFSPVLWKQWKILCSVLQDCGAAVINQMITRHQTAYLIYYRREADIKMIFKSLKDMRYEPKYAKQKLGRNVAVLPSTFSNLWNYL